ncbi:glucose-1-phosphate adenylyltransferase [Propioniciclava sinopodophylli]|uniref:Glucose-1-phosphate adenylyltransferase n=1 Tax=Propioniciclava sinopodophylli TaxID=1837344 RepID=A0A4Q9KGC4_9ACTN|nr:glucose-1-phosphate adenylyltransferase [Propioniciclava sinopodophylli]TBT87390.1 glucose-1-phosphate adenylyltransferase [Propioniciclava sinopodophylli]
MRNRPNVLSIVLAGGEGKRLMPLTADRAKPAVPFGGTYRLIDFVLSNLANSGLTKMAVLTQYKSHSLDRHIAQTWRMSTLLGSFVASVPAQQRTGKQWYMGSADAIYQSLNLITDEEPDYIVVFGADNIYRMDVNAMLEAHIDSGLECTVAGIRVPRSEASAFGIIDAADDAKILQFLEKPADPPGLPDSPDESFASMGNYIFTRKAFVEMLKADAEDPDSKHDMGGNVVPFFVNKGQAQVYDFTKNDVPGSTDKDRNYWRDVGTIDAYHAAHMDLVSVDPEFNLYNRHWPIFTQQYQAPGAKFTLRGTAEDSIVSAGCIISGGDVDRSVLSPNVVVDKWAKVEESVIFSGARVGRNAVVRRAILDKGVHVEDGAEVGVNRDADLARGFHVSDSGITVVSKNGSVNA